jgi:hypothetical protein
MSDTSGKMPDMVECIYCRARTSASKFTRPEHVVPKAFGKFQKNLTVFCVCEECNQWFGNNIEVSFNRNSGEAVMRLLFGVKPSHEATDVLGDRIDITAGDGSRFRGGKSYFTQHADGSTLVVAFEPQVGFAPSQDAEPILFREADLTPEAVARYKSQECFIIGQTEDDYQRLLQKLNELGLSAETVLWCHPDGSLLLVREAVRVDYRLDGEVFRVVAKIAFNYLTYVAGADFCLNSDFDPFRKFVRYGEGDWRSFIAVSQAPLLLDERRTGVRLTRGHLLVVEWRDCSYAPTASVKLFNDIHYHVRFAPRMGVIWRAIRSGHHFNIKTFKIDPIQISEFPP